jgi:hypothetical protein
VLTLTVHLDDTVNLLGVLPPRALDDTLVGDGREGLEDDVGMQRELRKAALVERVVVRLEELGRRLGQRRREEAG